MEALAAKFAAEKMPTLLTARFASLMASYRRLPLTELGVTEAVTVRDDYRNPVHLVTLALHCYCKLLSRDCDVRMTYLLCIQDSKTGSIGEWLYKLRIIFVFDFSTWKVSEN